MSFIVVGALPGIATSVSAALLARRSTVMTSTSCNPQIISLPCAVRGLQGWLAVGCLEVSNLLLCLRLDQVGGRGLWLPCVS